MNMNWFVIIKSIDSGVPYVLENSWIRAILIKTCHVTSRLSRYYPRPRLPASKDFILHFFESDRDCLHGHLECSAPTPGPHRATPGVLSLITRTLTSHTPSHHHTTTHSVVAAFWSGAMACGQIPSCLTLAPRPESHLTSSTVSRRRYLKFVGPREVVVGQDND